MQAHKRITAAINAANKDGRPALVPFITAGYPDPDTFIDTLKAVAAVGDVVELGIPFSDPMADGMTIQRSSFEALKKGANGFLCKPFTDEQLADAIVELMTG